MITSDVQAQMRQSVLREIDHVETYLGTNPSYTEILALQKKHQSLKILLDLLDVLPCVLDHLIK